MRQLQEMTSFTPLSISQISVSLDFRQTHFCNHLRFEFLFIFLDLFARKLGKLGKDVGMDLDVTMLHLFAVVQGIVDLVPPVQDGAELTVGRHVCNDDDDAYLVDTTSVQFCNNVSVNDS